MLNILTNKKQIIMKFEDFTPQQRHIIAEFVHSYDADILIKTDAIDLLAIMLDKKMISKKEYNKFNDRLSKNMPILEDIIEILFTCVQEKEGKKIMSEYFS